MTWIIETLDRLEQKKRELQLSPQVVFCIQCEISAASFILESGSIEELARAALITGGEGPEAFAQYVAYGSLLILQARGVDATNADAYIDERLSALEQELIDRR